MSSGPDDTGESFQRLFLQLRGRISLNQRELAAEMGVHVHSIQGWERGSNYPGVESLRAVIVVGLRAGGFTAGHEEEEAAALWAAAVRQAPRLRVPFDRIWFESVFVGQSRPVPRDDWPAPIETAAAAEFRPAAAPIPTNVTSSAMRGHSWGEAPDVVNFVGRTAEREQLAQWALDERCRMVGVLGLGGIGKTLLSARVARDVAPAFERVYWRSLLNAPTPGDWLAEALRQLEPEVALIAGDEPAQIRHLLGLLNETRSLLVMDNFETVLETRSLTVQYRDGFQGYGTVVQLLGETPHRSCLIMTSREAPPELRALRSDEQGPVRATLLGGFVAEEGRALLGDKGLDGDDDD